MAFSLNTVAWTPHFQAAVIYDMECARPLRTSPANYLTTGRINLSAIMAKNRKARYMLDTL